VSEILGWLALTVISGLVLAVGSLVDWKSIIARYFGGSESDDGDQ